MAKFGRPGAASWSDDRLDVFIKSPTGSLLHVWNDRGAEGARDLGGVLASEPVAVTNGEQRLDVFAREKGTACLLHWHWDTPLGRMVGPDRLPGSTVDDPVALASGGQSLHVFDVSVDGVARMWRSAGINEIGQRRWERPVHILDPFPSRLAAFCRSPGGLDLFVTGSDGQLEYWRNRNGQWLPKLRLGGSVTSEPIAFSMSPGRMDVFARNGNGVLTHWGDGFFSGPGPEGWFGPEGTSLPSMSANPFGAGDDPNVADMLVREQDASLRQWSWDARNRVWVGPKIFDRKISSDPMAIARGPQKLDVFARGSDGELLHFSRVGTVWSDRVWSPKVSEFQPHDTLSVEDNLGVPDYLLLRPADHLVVGVSTQGFVTSGTNPPRLTSISPSARVTLNFPPQHVAEEVSAPGAGPSAGGNVWQARLSGPSNLTFELDPRSEFDLTSAGLLNALDGARLVTDHPTAIEIPYGLVFQPRSSSAGQPVVARHPSRPVDFAGTTGLWRTRVGNSAADGNLQLKSIRASRVEPFPIALSLANRALVHQQNTPAAISRLELSALGGSLSAKGRWRSFEWDHQATLGRDVYVKTVTKGVMYPFGHRAIFVEVTERSKTEPVAVLRKTRTLIITEANRNGASDDRLAREFPFSEAEFTKLVFPGIAQPAWRRFPRNVRSLASLMEDEAQLRGQVSDLFVEIHGDMGYGGGPTVEDIADQPSSLPTLAARNLLDAMEQLTDCRRAIEAVRSGESAESVPVFFTPALPGAAPVKFPIRLHNASRDIHAELPMIFVADLDLNDGVRENFHALSRPEVLRALGEAYDAKGIVELKGMPISLIADNERSELSDTYEVRSLNIAGRVDGTFWPRLGSVDAASANAWGMKVTLPSMRTLLNEDPRVKLRFSDNYLATGAADIAFKVLGADDSAAPNGPLTIDFKTKSDRSGGLISPKIAADGLSRTKGLLNVEGELTHNTAQIFADGASVLGFNLKDLVATTSVPPEIITRLRDGEPPEVSMSWKDIPLREFSESSLPGFFPAANSKLDFSTVSSLSRNETTCRIGEFTLALPQASTSGRLLELTFKSLQFEQHTGNSPQLTPKGLSAKFVGKLSLLAVLQNAVGLSDALPKIEPSPSDITARFCLPVPDVKAFSFALSNVVFQAGLRVPFNGEPVSLALGFGSRKKPFTLTVLMFGGGGYLDIELDHTGLRRLEVSLQFGAQIAIGFGIGTVEVHAFGGIRYEMLPTDEVILTGFIRIGGSLELLGLITVSVELTVSLSYNFGNSSLIGRAKIVIEIDLTLLSDSVELDSGDWVIAGGAQEISPPSAAEFPPFLSPGQPLDQPHPGVEGWLAYRRAFA